MDARTQGQELVAFERYMTLRKSGGNHCHVNALPIPAAAAAGARKVNTLPPVNRQRMYTSWSQIVPKRLISQLVPRPECSKSQRAGVQLVVRLFCIRRCSAQ